MNLETGQIVRVRSRQYIRDVEDLLSHLKRRAQTLAERAARKLTERGEKEAVQMKKLLEERRARILKQEQQHKYYQLELFSSDELRQIEADRRHWRVRLQQLEEEIETEPRRIQQAYQVKASRVEPVGLVYLWPVSN